jgi:3-methyl-2-oxobutanoate hydroxymethyltransferase
MSSQSGAAPPPGGRRRITVPEFTALKGQQRIAMLTAYDYPTAMLLDQCGIEGILVGDSLSMVVQGHDTTLPVTLEEMIYHAEMVGRAVRHALVVVDMPFPSYHLGLHKAIESAGLILKRTGCQAVKLEGGAEQADVIAGLAGAGIPVMAHVGLRPQSIHQLGSYKVQRDAQRLLNDAQVAAQAGAFAVVLECIPAAIAAQITRQISVPTIGIGAGVECDGQILVIHDLLGMTPGRLPKHVKAYARLRELIQGAVQSYQADVRSGQFPGHEQTFD